MAGSARKPQVYSDGSCADKLPEDPHPQEPGQRRCAEHQRKARVLFVAKSRAKAAGVDASGPEWQPQPSARTDATGAAPDGGVSAVAWAPAAEAYEALVDESYLLASHREAGTGLPASDTARFADRVDDLMFVFEPLLYATGHAPDAAPGPPSQAPHDLGTTDPHERAAPGGPRTRPEDVDVDEVRRRTGGDDG